MSGLDQKGTYFPNGINVPEGKTFIDGVAVTPSAAELNIINGVTATTAEINKLAGVTATAAQLNYLAGVTTPGTVAASKAVVVDVNKQVTEIGLSTAAFIKGEKFIVNIPLFSAAGVAIPLFIAPAACEVVEARETHVTVCDAADTMTLEKVASAGAPGSGTVVLVGNFTLNSTANTPVTVACHGTLATRQMAAGESLMAKYVSGDGTSYAGACLTVVMKWV